MKKVTKISSLQLFSLIIGYIIGSTAIMNSAAVAKADSGIAFIIAWAGGFVFAAIYILIFKLNPSQTLIEILQNNFGKIIGNFIGILYILYFIHLASLVFRNFGEFIVTVTYTQTPMIVIITCLAVLVAYALRSGFEVNARSTELIFLVIPTVVMLVNFSMLASCDFSAMLPVLENGIGSVLGPAYSVLTFPFGETVAFLMIFPLLNKPENISKVCYWGFFVSGALLLIALMRNLFVLGPNLVLELTYPSQVSARLIPGLNIDPLIDLAYFIGGGVKTSVLIYGASVGIVQIFDLEDNKPFIIPITTLCTLISVWIYKDIIDMFRWAKDIYPNYSIGFEFFIPTALLIVSFFRKKRNVKTQGKKEKQLKKKV